MYHIKLVTTKQSATQVTVKLLQACLGNDSEIRFCNSHNMQCLLHEISIVEVNNQLLCSIYYQLIEFFHEQLLKAVLF